MLVSHSFNAQFSNNISTEGEQKIKGDGFLKTMFFWIKQNIFEFSGFLLFKELSRQLKNRNALLSEAFHLLARDEARHAGFINKAMSDFNLSLDLGYLTKNRDLVKKIKREILFINRFLFWNHQIYLILGIVY